MGICAWSISICMCLCEHLMRVCASVCVNVCACIFVYAIVYTHIVCGSVHRNKNGWIKQRHTHLCITRHLEARGCICLCASVYVFVIVCI